MTWAPELEITRHMRWLERGGPLFAYDEIADADNVPFQMLYTANVSLKRSFLEPFDTELPIYEDTELAYRLSKRGLRLRYDPDALGHHFRVETPERTEKRMEEVGHAAALLHAKWPELREPPPRHAGGREAARPAERDRAAAASAITGLTIGWTTGAPPALSHAGTATARTRARPRPGRQFRRGELAAGGRRRGQLPRRSSIRKRASTPSVRSPYSRWSRNETLEASRK